jgi:Rieske Fe-S protein
MTAGTTSGMNRRRALGGIAAAGIGAPLLVACGGDDGGSTATEPEESSGDGGSGSGSGSGEALGPTSDVPVGGGTIFADQEVVVTQPAEGDFKAFTAICTHQGCAVGKVEDNTIMCPCHGSAFSAEDGSVTTGPATEPLAAVEISVKGDEISLA